jgi:thiosulfate/3-mercaptopyruvate sulfurtransferase
MSAWTGALALQVPGPLVETGWLADHQGEVVILDVRKDAARYLGKPLGPDEKPNLKKLTGHIPGAVSVPWKKVVAKGGEEGATLKAMLPSADAFAALMRASGVGNGSPIIIAGQGLTAKDQAHATRLYFTLKYFGHDNVALLDGGTAQWAKEGRPLAHTPETPTEGDFTVTEIREHLLAGTQDVGQAIASGSPQLLDCRTEDYFLGLTYKRGFVTPGDKGHLPGAKSLPFVLLGDNAGPAKLFSPDEMRQVASIKGVDLNAPTIAYCNTGVTASLDWFALHEILGNKGVRLYDGSMHAWSTVDASPGVASLAQIAAGLTQQEAEQPVWEAPAQALLIQPQATRSLQTLVDERRDALRRRRNDYFDALSGRRLYQPSWLAAREQMLDDYRDSVRTAHRQHRDTLRLYRDAVRRANAPWSRPYQDRAEIRQFVTQMEQLDRQELLDGLRFTQAYLPW